MASTNRPSGFDPDDFCFAAKVEMGFARDGTQPYGGTGKGTVFKLPGTDPDSDYLWLYYMEGIKKWVLSRTASGKERVCWFDSPSFSDGTVLTVTCQGDSNSLQLAVNDASLVDWTYWQPGLLAGDPGQPEWITTYYPDENGHHPLFGRHHYDENGEVYPDDEDLPTVGTLASPAAITFNHDGLAITGASWPGGVVSTDGDGYTRIENVKIYCSTFTRSGSGNAAITAHTTISAVASSVTLDGDPLTFYRFDHTLNNGKVYVQTTKGAVACTFTGASSSTDQITGVTTNDGLTYTVLAEMIVYQPRNFLRMRNVLVMHPEYEGFTPARTTVGTAFRYPNGENSRLATSITQGTQPSTVTVASTSGFPSSGKILVGCDFVTYTAISATQFQNCTWDNGTGATRGWFGAGSGQSVQVFQASGTDLNGNPAAVTITVADTSAFPATSGKYTVVMAGGVGAFSYQSKTATTFVGCTFGRTAFEYAAQNIDMPVGTILDLEVNAQVLGKNRWGGFIDDSRCPVDDMRDVMVRGCVETNGSLKGSFAGGGADSLIENFVIKQYIGDAIHNIYGPINPRMRHTWINSHPDSKTVDEDQHVDCAKIVGGTFSAYDPAWDWNGWSGHTANDGPFCENWPNNLWMGHWGLTLEHQLSCVRGVFDYNGINMGVRHAWTDPTIPTWSTPLGGSTDGVVNGTVSAGADVVTLDSITNIAEAASTQTNALATNQTVATGGSLTFAQSSYVSGTWMVSDSQYGFFALSEGANACVCAFVSRSGPVVSNIKVLWSTGSLDYTTAATLVRSLGQYTASNEPRYIAWTGKTTSPDPRLTGVFGLQDELADGTFIRTDSKRSWVDQNNEVVEVRRSDTGNLLASIGGSPAASAESSHPIPTLGQTVYLGVADPLSGALVGDVLWAAFGAASTLDNTDVDTIHALGTSEPSLASLPAEFDEVWSEQGEQPVPITAANLTTLVDDNGGVSSATASITPTANSLVLATVVNRKATTPDIPTLTGNGLTWVQVQTLTGSTTRTTMFRALGGAPSAGAVTADFGGVSQLSTLIVVDEIAGVDTGGSNGADAVVQSVTANAASGTTATVTLAAFGNSANATYGAVMVASDVHHNPGSGFTELSDIISSSGNARSLGTEWKNTPDTGVDFTWTGSLAWQIIGLELKNAVQATNIPANLLLLGVG